MLLTIVVFVAIAWLLSSSWTRRAVPFESFVAFAFAGVVMVTLLVTGRLA